MPTHPQAADKINEAVKGNGDIKLGLLFNHGYLPGVINRADDEHCVVPVSKMCRKDGAFGKVRQHSPA